MRIFITGAAGFFGKHLVHRLVNLGHNPVALIHKPTTSQEDIERLKQQSVELVFADILDPVEKLMILMRGCQHVIHAAAIYDLSAKAELVRRVNVQGAENVMEAARRLDIPCVFISSATSCGIQKRGFNEDFVYTKPLCFYGLTKRHAERKIEVLIEKGLKVVTLMPGGLLGPGDVKETGRYIEALIARPLPFGRGFPSLSFPDTAFTFLHVLDLVDVTIEAMFNQEAIGKRYLVGGHTVTQHEFHSMIAQAYLGRPLFRRGYWMPNWFMVFMIALLSKISAVLGRRPPWDLTMEQIKLMREGLAFNGSRVRKDLLPQGNYRPLEDAIKDYFDHRSKTA